MTPRARKNPIRFPDFDAIEALVAHYAAYTDAQWAGIITDTFTFPGAQKPKKRDYHPLLSAFFPPGLVRAEMQRYLTAPLALREHILISPQADQGYIGYLEKAHKTTGRGPDEAFDPGQDKSHLSLDERISKQDIIDVLDMLAQHPHTLVTVAALQNFFIGMLDRITEGLNLAHASKGGLLPARPRHAFRDLAGVIPFNRALFAGAYTFHLLLVHRHHALKEGRPLGVLTEADVTHFIAYAPKRLFTGPTQSCPFATMINAAAAMLWQLHQHAAPLAKGHEVWLRPALEGILRDSCLDLGLARPGRADTKPRIRVPAARPSSPLPPAPPSEIATPS